MDKYVAFLRGINVGGRIIRMVDLKKCFEDSGFKNVSTLLQSGNVLFETDSENTLSLKQRMEEALSKKFNYPAKVQIYSFEKIVKVAENYPFDVDKRDFQSYVVFIEGNLGRELAAEVVGLDKKTEQIKQNEGIIYWKVQKGMTLKSSFSRYLVKSKYKQFNTVRNLNTLKKIAGRQFEEGS